LKRLLPALTLKSIELYQNWISPALPASCRFLPTCSDYAAEAVRRHGTIKGGYLTARRLARCHPFCEGGVDPVPEKTGSRTALAQNTGS